MRREAKPGKAKVEPKQSGARKSRKNEGSGVRQLQKRLAEALEQQTATSEILQVISSSPTDVQPTFEAIAARARRLCEAAHGMVFRFDGELLHLAAHDNLGPDGLDAIRSVFPIPPGRGSVTARAILTRALVHVRDRREDRELEYSVLSANFPNTLSVPLLRDGVPLGAITVARAEIGLFSARQIALLQTFADQAVIAIENVRLFTELQAKNSALTTAHAQVTEALEQQTATAEILRVISRSPTDLRPVMEAVAENAARLCDATDAQILRGDGETITLVASYGRLPTITTEPRRISRRLVGGRAIIDRVTLHISDVRAARDEFPDTATVQLGVRTVLATPLLREGVAIGVIMIRRMEVRPFSDKQIALLQTFADQAVIAIENVRLFAELQASNSELTTALDTQTATSDILRVISRSQTDVQPVFDAIVHSAARLLRGYGAVLTRIAGDQIELAALTSTDDAGNAAVRAIFPQSLQSEWPYPQAIRNRAPLNITDFPSDLRWPEAARDRARVRGSRSWVVVPMLHHDAPVGTISVIRREPGGFSDDEIALLQTFADQAVIAIENVRLFKELEGRNRDLTEALEQQTATAEILRVISQSQTDVQPVFDTIVRSAAQLCHAAVAAVFQTDGRMVYHPANYGGSPEALAATRARYPRRLDMETMPGMAILTRSVVNLPDIEDPSLPEHVRQVGRVLGFRSALAVPMLREGEAVGAITAHRREPGRFSDAEVELLKTFADQAVIAVENVRLFKELEARTGELTQSVEKLTALGEVSRAVSSTLDVETVLHTIVSRASQLAGGAGCSIFEYDAAAEQFELRATHNDDTEFVEALRAVPLRKGEGLMGRAAEMREPIQIPDITQPGAYESSVRDTLIRFGYHALLAVPLLREDQIIGSLSFNRKEAGEFPPEVVDVLKTFATQSALAIQNARLFREIADKSAQLEAASRHKSEFLANMSHELRTPLNAIIGFSEVLTERMFGELNEKQDEYLKDIHASGQHLLSLINDILDLSKIEAGRMELEVTDFDLPNAIDNALILVRERATRRGITLGHSVDERLGTIRGDERKVKQVLLNLLSNALKFTPEGGRIDVRAVPHDGVAEISVTDTGVGIAPEDQEAVFEEFRQVGTADKKVEGTGLGLALSRKFIELHGGRIWVESEVGKGSTFRFTLPST
jgi:signal transduction histidine kinase